jgi:hypothetical protein
MDLESDYGKAAIIEVLNSMFEAEKIQFRLGACWTLCFLIDPQITYFRVSIHTSI